MLHRVVQFWLYLGRVGRNHVGWIFVVLVGFGPSWLGLGSWPGLGRLGWIWLDWGCRLIFGALVLGVCSYIVRMRAFVCRGNRVYLPSGCRVQRHRWNRTAGWGRHGRPEDDTHWPPTRRRVVGVVGAPVVVERTSPEVVGRVHRVSLKVLGDMLWNCAKPRRPYVIIKKTVRIQMVVISSQRGLIMVVVFAMTVVNAFYQRNIEVHINQASSIATLDVCYLHVA